MMSHLCATFVCAASRDARSAQLRKKLASLLLPSRALHVAIYAAQRHEVHLLPLLHEYPQHHYAFPRCVARTGQMDFYHVDDERQLQAGAYGIPEPLESCARIAASQLDIIIVPGIAFGENGERLGHGGGYYDRYLQRAPQARLFALAFREQFCADIPLEQHDRCIDKIFWEE